MAEIAGTYLRKGSTIYVESPIRYRTWEDSEGWGRFTTEVEVREMTLLDGPRSEDSDLSFDLEELETAVN